MARSDPARSDYCATRHLLRHFRHAREVRRNPLACDAFATASDAAALGTIAWRVCDALRAMDARPAPGRYSQSARHTTILLRVDIQHHDPIRVAADLGLSDRQYHRERRLAHARFLDAFRGTLAVTAPPAPCVVPQQLTELAASLADSGEVLSAVALLDDVASNAEPGDRCGALIQRAEIEAWSHRLDRARLYADDACSLLTAVSPAHDGYGELRDAFIALELLLQWFALGPAVVGRQRPSEMPSSRAGPRELVVRATAALRNGEANDALQFLDRLQLLGAPLPAAVVADAAMLQAEIADFVGEEESVSETHFKRAASAAMLSGLRGRALYATHQLASTRWMHSRSPLDRSAYRSLVDGIDRTLPPRLRSYLIFSAADIEVAIGHPRRALQAAGTAATVSTNHYETFSAQALEAGALLRMGRIREAGARAAQASASARMAGHYRILSLTQRVQALAQLSQGNRPAATAAIEESIECAKRSSSTHVLAKAKAIRDQIGRG